jgi:hypothetical protein
MASFYQIYCILPMFPRQADDVNLRTVPGHTLARRRQAVASHRIRTAARHHPCRRASDQALRQPDARGPARCGWS